MCYNVCRSCYQEVKGPQAGGPFPFAKRGDVDEGTAPAYPQDAGSPDVSALRQADSTGGAEAPGSVLFARLRRDNLWYTDPAPARPDGDRRAAHPYAPVTRWRGPVPCECPQPPPPRPGPGGGSGFSTPPRLPGPHRGLPALFERWWITRPDFF